MENNLGVFHHLKKKKIYENMIKLDHFPGENKKSLKPPPR